MDKNSNRKYKGKKIPIFKEDLEFEIFHAKNLQQIDNDKLNFQKEYFNRTSKELSFTKGKDRVSVLEKMISDHNIEDFKLEGLNQLDRQEEICLENQILLLMLQNYQAIPYSDKDDDKSDVIYQTSYFEYTNPHTFGEEIGKLYKNLKKAKYINCSGPTFRSIFSDTTSFDKVNWLKSQSSFQLFVRLLVEKEKVICRDLWVTASSCFLINGAEKSNVQLGKVETPSSHDAILIRECIKDFK